jgi:hypothetical protein
MMPKYMVIMGVEGESLAREIREETSQRIAGPKPWGGGEIVQSFDAQNDLEALRVWETNQYYQGVVIESRLQLRRTGDRYRQEALADA